MFDPKPVGGTGLPTNRTSAIGYARYTSGATGVKTKGGRAVVRMRPETRKESFLDELI